VQCTYWGHPGHRQLLGQGAHCLAVRRRRRPVEDGTALAVGKAVFVGRFTAALRALVPGMARMAPMPYARRFLPWNVLGGALWAAGFVVLGYLAGSQYKTIEHYANYLGLALLVAIAAFFFLRHRREQRQDQQPVST